MGLVFSAIIFFGIILSGLVIIMFRISDNKLRLLLAFGGAFILAITFLEIVPEIYKSESTEYAGLFMLIGFLIQLFVDFLTKGADHGHKHDHNKEKNSLYISSLPLLIGVCIHSFFEALPLSDLFENLEVKWALVFGILIHNIPISFVLMGLFLNSGYSKMKSLAFLLVFAIAAPLGIMVSSQIGLFIETDISLLYTITMSIVVGIFLHISTTVLFETSENHRFNFYKILSILLGIIAAFLIIHGHE